MCIDDSEDEQDQSHNCDDATDTDPSATPAAHDYSAPVAELCMDNFEELVINPNYYFIRNLCYNKLLNWDFAMDATQDTFVNAFKSCAQYNKEKASIRTWLCAIAKNACTDIFRDKSRSDQSIDEDTEGDPYKEKQFYQEVFKHCYNLLPEDERKIIRLKYVKELPAKAIVARLGKTDKWVANVLKRARNRFLRCIEGQGWFLPKKHKP